MRNTALGVCLLAATALMPATASASLIGDTVTATFSNPNAADVSASGVVGAGPEFAIASHSFDFGANNVAVDVGFGTFPGFFGFAGSTTTLVLSSLDLGAPIAGVDFSTSVANMTMSFTADSVTFSFPDNSPHTGVWLTATFLTEQAVPTPAALALFGVGLVGLALTRRTTKRLAA